jgi:hypothetical protein
MSTKVASSGARRGGVTSFAVPEHHRDGPVNPMLVQTMLIRMLDMKRFPALASPTWQPTSGISFEHSAISFERFAPVGGSR